ncbi:Pentatricopeptide repeat-containing protein [Nymphaea thermarum]|nr:Pentatricopeptide repeat-containing protein [Nymphaea thermarum]
MSSVSANYSLTLLKGIGNTKQKSRVVECAKSPTHCHVRFSLPSLWRSCGTLKQITESANIAAPVVVHGFPLQNHLLEKLADCRCMDFARVIFDRLHVVNDFSLNSMIKNYAINGLPENSILLYCLLYREMLENFIKQSNFSFAMMVGDRLIRFHASFHSIDDAKHIFGEMPERDLVSWNSIISVCVSVGEVELAHQLLNEIPMLRNVVSWIAQVGGYGQAGRPAEMVQSVVPNEAIRLFDQMYEEEMKPNDITMVSLLSACAVLGDCPGAKHAPFEPDAVIWGSRLSARRIHNDVELADRIGRIGVPPVSANHRKQMKLRKPAGSSCVEVDCASPPCCLEILSRLCFWASSSQSSGLMIAYSLSLVIVFLGHLLAELVVCSLLWTATAAALTSAPS